MANIAVGNFYKHRTYCYAGDQVSINTRYFTIVLITGSVVTEQSLTNALDTVLAALYKPALFNSASYIGSDIQNITGAKPYPIQTFTNSNQGAGTGGASTQGSQVSGLITLRTAYTGKGYRGRAYIPFPSAVFSTTSSPPTMTSAYATLLDAIANQTTGGTVVTAGGTNVGLGWLIAHSQPPAVRGTYTAVLSGSCGVAWATQKRRGDYGRTNPVPVQ